MNDASPKTLRLAERTQLSLIRLCRLIEQAETDGQEVPSYLLKLVRRLTNDCGQLRNTIDDERRLFAAVRNINRQERRKRSKRPSAGRGQRIRGRLLDQWDGRCHYCKRPTEKPTLDHVVPTSKGGVHDDHNCVIACDDCNQWKADKNLKEWASEILGRPRRRWFGFLKGGER